MLEAVFLESWFRADGPAAGASLYWQTDRPTSGDACAICSRRPSRLRNRIAAVVLSRI
jgi:hypothetical protein